jgi:hypothetical protein
MTNTITLPRAVVEEVREALRLAHGTVTETDWEFDFCEELAALEAALAEPVEHRCHLEIEVMPDGFEPDGCVLDGGNPDHCMYAKRYGDKAREHCGEWKPFIRKEGKT